MMKTMIQFLNFHKKDTMNRASIISAFIVFTLVLVSCNPCLDPIGEIETYYAARGPFETDMSLILGYELYYPKEMAEGQHPIITWGNGTHAVPLVYRSLLDHFASYGFVVIASTSKMTGSGAEMLEGVDWLMDENSRAESIFFNKLDFDKVGATGHSQGGGGTINAGNDPRIKCTAPIEPIPGNIHGLKGPMFLIAGAADSLVLPSGITSEIYNPALVPTIYGIAIRGNHLTPLVDGGMMRGYLTAWFCAELMEHDYAKNAFYGEDEECEIYNNNNWDMMRKNL
jgi:hypothetical protein